jgi:hypothetical protein
VTPDHPREFFERWLPAEFAKAGGAPGIHTLVRVELDGEGAWNLQVNGATMEIVPDGGDADVIVAQTVEDWRATTEVTPKGTTPRDLLMLDASTQQALAGLKGVVRFEVTGFAGRTWQLTVAFGKGTPVARPLEPQSTITVDAETQKALLTGKMMPPEAYFAGKIQIRGDVSLAMQLGMAMMSRLSGRRPT